jgi:tripartite-type tricarboxylate transporter receptor subunit TctC
MAAALTALIGGQVDVEFAGPGVAKSLMDGGKIKVLAVASPHRLPLLPQVPPIAEAGVPGLELSGWYAILAPAKTPPEIVERLTAEIKKAVANPRFAKRMQDQGLEVIGSTPAEMLAAMRADTQKWKHIIDLTGTKVVQ